MSLLLVTLERIHRSLIRSTSSGSEKTKALTIPFQDFGVLQRWMRSSDPGSQGTDVDAIGDTLTNTPVIGTVYQLRIRKTKALTIPFQDSQSPPALDAEF